MRWLQERVRRDPGAALLVLALLGALALYAPTVGDDLVNYDDAWLVRDNAILAHPSGSAVATVFTDFSPDTRFVLGAEYLPVRDLSIMGDRALWGDRWGGFHATNVALYLAAIALWFFALVTFGIERAVAGAAMLVWAVHPAHVESVAWLAERKGLLGVMFAGAVALGYARWRRGGSTANLVVAAIATGCAVWSKAPMAFAVAALAPIELLAPAVRASWKRSLVGLGVLAVVGAASFAPVVMTASAMAVVGESAHAPAGWLPMALGLHGFYVQLAAMLVANSVSYPVATNGPSVGQIIVGAVALFAVLAAAVMALSPRWRARVPPGVGIAAWLWLMGWFPVSRLVLPLRNVLAADRYLLVATLGFALAFATAAVRLSPRMRTALLAVLVLAAGLRACDALGSWRSTEALWERAVASNPDDGDAWAAYSEAIATHGDDERALRAAIEGYNRTKAPRLALRLSLLALDHGDAVRGRKLMEMAAQGGEVRAQANLSVLLLGDGRTADAAAVAREATIHAPYYAKGHQALGNAELVLDHIGPAIEELRRAHALAPADVHIGCDLGIALSRRDENFDEAVSLVTACEHDARYADRVRAILARVARTQ